MRLFKGRRDTVEQGRAREELRWLTTLAREDLVELGERLEDEAPPQEVDALAERELARAITAEARVRLREAETADAVLEVQGSIGQAFVHLARSDAIVRGEEPPTRNDPCEFNPQHGPADVQVDWTPIGGETATFTCCRQDADLIAAGRAPRTRKISVDGTQVEWQDLRGDRSHITDSRLDIAALSATTYHQVAVSLSTLKAAGNVGASRP